MLPVLKAILTHAAISVAIAVSYGELLIGISLMIGLLSRVASVFGCVLTLAMWLSGVIRERTQRSGCTWERL
jgi:uncharacterized membrane protein YphA (DoxX/SURF4 family)